MHTTDDLIQLALREDIGPGDITTDHLVAPQTHGQGTISAKADLVIAGLEVAAKVFRALDPAIAVKTGFQDGDSVSSGSTVIAFTGSLRALLRGERTALNFLQRLSGIATQTRNWVEMVAGTAVKLVDTRKTTPGWRTLEKYAVRIGGAYNHRMGLYDGVLIKDNHIAVCGGIRPAVQQVRRGLCHLLKVEVEADSLEAVQEALAAGADVIMLDNMDIAQIRRAVRMIDRKVPVEASGNVTRKNLKALAQTGVDFISIGALTHSAVAVDLSMHIEKI